ncbi:hypothetical protein, partial [Pseudoalteromonas ruthenica]|uniref:hypothetical protein n=1 Tax=Pseudoalteromonas ruthenica TaxID=151081 RepID=UPI001279B6E8
ALRAPAQRIYIGRFNELYLLIVARVGYYAELVRETQNKIGRLARWRSSWEGRKHLYPYSTPPVRLELGGKVPNQRQLMRCLANRHSFGGGMKVAPEATVPTGALMYIIIQQCAHMH